MNIIAFCHDIRRNVIEFTGKDNAIARFVVDERATADTINFEIVGVGKVVLNFVMEQLDFEDYEKSKTFILDEVKRNLE